MSISDPVPGVDPPDIAERTAATEAAIAAATAQAMQIKAAAAVAVAARKDAVKRAEKALARVEAEAARASSDFAGDDLGNADRLIAAHGQDLVMADGCWFVWDGHRFVSDPRGEYIGRQVWRLAQELRTERRADPGNIELEAASKRLGTSQGIRACLDVTALADTVTRMSRGDFDADPTILTVANGTIDLRTGQLRDSSRSDYCSRMVDIHYDAQAVCPKWRTAVSQILGGSQELVDYIQRVFGYCLTGSTREQALFILHGSGSNGKSTLVTILQRVCGEFGWTTPIATLLRSNKTDGDAASPSVAALAGARCVTSSESGKGKALDEALIKLLTGSDSITARFLHQDQFTFTPTHKILLSTNHRPQIRDTDPAIWRRPHLIPFQALFANEGDEEHRPGALPKNKGLDEELVEELPGILAWAVEGARLWHEHGLQPPEAVRAAVKEYRAEEDVVTRSIQEFIADRLVDEIDPNKCLSPEEMRAAYAQWAGNDAQLNRETLKTALEERGWTQERTKGKRRWSRGTGAGVRLRQDLDPWPGETQPGKGSDRFATN